ncbi:class I SAM-dependent methyltransferase [Shewanella subflava]|uniref:class I SAM-dependent methyltransferase n=1 Tax=Shewanella subflava TaxID=2986476 RepID=UPI0038736F2B
MAHIPTEACSPLSWLEFASGEQLKTELEDRLNLWWPRLFGYHLLKLGPLSAEINSLQCQINHHFSLFESEGGVIQASTKDLPLQSSSIDTVLMTSLLEFEQDPYRVLREIDRVIVSGGHIILSGFNPISPLFFGKLLPQFQNVAPWCGHFFMPSRVKDWLGLLGYQILSDERLVYHHLLTDYPSTFAWHNQLEKWLPSTGGIYLIVAKKVDTPLTPIRDKQKVKSTNWSAAPSAGRAGLKSRIKS